MTGTYIWEGPTPNTMYRTLNGEESISHIKAADEILHYIKNEFEIK